MSTAAALTAKPAIPDIGALFQHKGATWRVGAWIREEAVPAPSPMVRRMIESLGDTPKTARRVWSTRDQATHVAGGGLCGCIAPIDQIVVTGEVDWSDEMIVEERQFAEALAAAGDEI